MPATTLVQSVTRSLDMLQALAGADAGLRLSEVAQRLSLKAPTAHNLLQTLVARGFVVRRGPGPRYALGPAALSLADAHRARRLLEVVEDHVRRMAQARPDAVVTYCEPVGPELEVRLRVTPEQPGFVQRPLERSMLPYATASGLVMLAYAAPEERDGILRRYPFSETGAALWGGLDALDDYLRRVRKQRYAAPQLKNKGLAIAAAPLMRRGVVAGVLGMAAPLEPAKQEETRTRLVAALVEHAGAVSLQL
jgi:DNA-binding IclR family transcriptional regulator